MLHLISVWFIPSLSFLRILCLERSWKTRSTTRTPWNTWRDLARGIVWSQVFVIEADYMAASLDKCFYEAIKVASFITHVFTSYLLCSTVESNSLNDLTGCGFVTLDVSLLGCSSKCAEMQGAFWTEPYSWIHEPMAGALLEPANQFTWWHDASHCSPET